MQSRFTALFLILFFALSGFSQTTPTYVPKARSGSAFVQFEKSKDQLFGFDDCRYKEWTGEYVEWVSPQVESYYIPYKSIESGKSDLVSAKLFNGGVKQRDSIRFIIIETSTALRYTPVGTSSYRIQLPASITNYTVAALYNEVELGRMNVVFYEPQVEKLIIVPVTEFAYNEDSIRTEIREIFRQALFIPEITFEKQFRHPDIDTGKFDNPSNRYDRYTKQMRELRDLYFATHPKADKKAYYLFVIPGFNDESIRAYTVKNKAIGFIALTESTRFSRVAARTLARGIGLLDDSWNNNGPKKGTTDNLMDRGRGIHLRHLQWNELRHTTHSYSFFDNYEDVKTNNGLVAYYFWKENPDGTIKLENGNFINSVSRPFKKNFFSYHLNINIPAFYTLFTVYGKRFNLLHILLVLGILFGVIYSGRKVNRIIRVKFRRSWYIRTGVRILAFFLTVTFCWLSVLLVDLCYRWFEVKQGVVTELAQLKRDDAIRTVGDNFNARKPTEDRMGSEFLIKRGSQWSLERQLPVVYFTIAQDSAGKWNKVRFSHSDDSLIVSLKDLRVKAESHYIVLNFIQEDSSITAQQVYNHIGVDISSKLKLADPVKRILLFVNGYRPTSIGHTFEDNFSDIRKKGLEFPDSKNIVYDFDRYDYWRPWQGIDLLFQKRINPVETFYADGHFSVSTSNHRSLFNFSTTSSAYPKRCENRKYHHCFYQRTVTRGLFGLKKVKTLSMLSTKPNKKGFRKRRENGRVAGKNILQMLNELPNRSENDTVFIVAHSMGYAYALGIIDELRGKVAFGDLYILAPENAGSGSVNKSEWRHIWQYGSNFGQKAHDAPCLLDGVAPQVAAGGLPSANRIYIPFTNYRKKGFFDSHFIGYYTWIFDIPKGKPGFVEQR